MQRQNDEDTLTGHTGAVGSGRATVRLLESLVRLSEAHARLMCRSHEVELQVGVGEVVDVELDTDIHVDVGGCVYRCGCKCSFRGRCR